MPAVSVDTAGFLMGAFPSILEFAYLVRALKTVSLILPALQAFPQFLQSVQTFIIEFSISVFKGIPHFLIERKSGDRCRDLDPFCPKGELILFQRFHDRPANALTLMLRMHKYCEQTAFVWFVPIRSDRAAADDPAVILDNVKVCP